MKIKVKLHDSFLKDTLEELQEGYLEVKKGQTVGDLLQQLQLSPHAVVVTLNNKIASKERLIKEGDKIEIYPIVMGG